jgi:hypothetical protein
MTGSEAPMHAAQPTVKAAWLLPPEGPDWWARYKVVTLPLGVALDSEQRGACTRIGNWPPPSAR